MRVTYFVIQQSVGEALSRDIRMYTKETHCSIDFSLCIDSVEWRRLRMEQVWNQNRPRRYQHQYSGI